MAWIKGSDGNTWHNLDQATKAWVQPSDDTSGQFELMAHINGTDVQLGLNESEAVAGLVLKNYLS